MLGSIRLATGEEPFLTEDGLWHSQDTTLEEALNLLYSPDSVTSPAALMPYGRGVIASAAHELGAEVLEIPPMRGGLEGVPSTESEDEPVEVMEGSLPEGTRTRESTLLEEGFTGVVKDRLGRLYRWVNGERQKANTPPIRQRPAAHELAGILAAQPTGMDVKAAAEKTGAGWQGLSKQTKLGLAQAYAGGKKLVHYSETSYRIGRNVALAVAKERGASPEWCERAGKIIGMADAILGWTVNFPAVTLLTGNPLLGKISSWVPIASMAYIAYSGRNPIKTIRAASRALSSLDVLKGHKEKPLQESIEHLSDLHELTATLLDRLQERGNWYEALVVVALDVTHDLENALTLADWAYEAQPREEESDLLEDKQLFTGVITDILGRRFHYINGKRIKSGELLPNKITRYFHPLPIEHEEADTHARRIGLVGEKYSPRVLVDKDYHQPSPLKARVGVPAFSVPPPPSEIPRLPNLSLEQRDVEDRFATGYLANPERYVAKYRRALEAGKVGVAPNVYATDDVKMLNKDWNPGRAKVGESLPKVSKEAMAKYNTAVHATANAISKKAFLQKLDEIAALPEGDPLKSVLVTNGACASGKGSTLSHAAEPDSPYNKLVPAAAQVGAVWDAAGEQNATENSWILQECKKRGITATFAYVWAEPENTWDAPNRGVVRRAIRKGRMVDCRLYADSHAEGAKNMHAFVKANPGANFIFIDNRVKGDPKLLDKFPEETLQWDGEQIYKMAVDNLKSHKNDLSKALYEGGLNGIDIWGPPQPTGR